MRASTRRTGSPSGRVIDAATGVAVGALAGLLALRRLPRDVHRFQLAVEGARDATLTVAPLLAVVAAARRRPGTALAAVAVSAQSATLRSVLARALAPSTDPTVPATLRVVTADTLRVVTANLLSGNRRIEDLGRQLVADRADVIVVQELTPRHAAGLRAAGLLDAMPHHVLDPQPGFHGSGVLSRWPMSAAVVHDMVGMPMAAATVHAPGGAVAVISVHVISPARAGAIPVWRAQLERLAEHVRGLDIPAVLAGDYNATRDHRGLRVLRAAGLVDAHDAAGHGLGLTWPQRSHTRGGRWPALPLMRLDHVFVTATVAVSSVRTARSDGSDHRRVVAELVLPQR